MPDSGATDLLKCSRYNIKIFFFFLSKNLGELNHIKKINTDGEKWPDQNIPNHHSRANGWDESSWLLSLSPIWWPSWPRPSLGKHILGVIPCSDGMPLSLRNVSATDRWPVGAVQVRGTCLWRLSFSLSSRKMSLMETNRFVYQRDTSQYTFQRTRILGDVPSKRAVCLNICKSPGQPTVSHSRRLTRHLGD